MTRRGTLLLVGLAVVLALGEKLPALVAPALVAVGVAVVAVVVDSRLAPGSTSISVRRQTDPILSVGHQTSVTLDVECADGRPRQLLLSEAIPPAVAGPAMPLRVRAPERVSYAITPLVRGDAAFGQATVRAIGPLGLGFRQSRVGDALTVAVDADISALGRHRALARTTRLIDIGLRSVRQLGEGREFERIREATPDDPPRSINWRATARTGRLMAMDFVPERSQPVILCYDHGRLMGTGSVTISKLDCALNASVLLAQAALDGGDQVGAFAFAEQVSLRLRPRPGRGQLRRLLSAVQPIHPVAVEPDYDRFLVDFSSWQTRRSLLVIFTDLLDRDQGAALIRQCLRLRRRHLPLVVAVRDPGLADLATQPPVDAIATFERSVAVGLVNDRTQALRQLAVSGVDVVDADARTLTPRLLSRYLTIKHAGRL